MNLIILTCYWLLCITTCAAKIDPFDFLVNYGYLKKNAFSSIKDAIRQMQYFANLPETGELDNATRATMQMPRCGMADHEDLAYYGGSRKWNKNDLTYRIENYTPDMSNSEVDRIMAAAFQMWADYIPLRFTKTNQAGDFSIVFGSYRHSGGWGKNGDGACNARFDGRGGVLAHAYFPPDGRAHFDESESYSDKSHKGTNLFWVAAHEFGHALGLSHSRVRGALMYPYYTGYKENFYLPDDDVRRITSLYGRRGTLAPGQTWPPRPTPGTLPPGQTRPTGNCIDLKGEAHCKARSGVCKTSHDGWRTYMKQYCYNTCYCNGGPAPNTVPVQTWEPTPQTLQPTENTGGSGVVTMKPTVELPKVTGAACKDKAGQYCINHVKSGKCAATDSTWKNYMIKNCYKSCYC